MENYEKIYSKSFDVSKIKTSDQKEFIKTTLGDLPVAIAVLLHIFTLGLFTLIYYGLIHSKLPKIKSDDFSGGKAIGFMFIPFFNLYWQFIFWLRLVDRINLQLKMRNIEELVPRGLILATRICAVVPYLNFMVLPILSPICVGFVQSAINKTVRGKWVFK